MLKFKINTHCGWYEPIVNTFNGGEEYVGINQQIQYPTRVVEITVVAKLKNSSDVMKLLLLKDALSRNFPSAVTYNLVMDYVPYARQDRVCNKGESLSIRVFCNLINAMNFDSVQISDPHSDVTPALINNCKITEQSSIISNSLNLNSYDAIVAPDYGSTKKAETTAKIFNKEVIQGVKHRDLATGNLTGFGYFGDVSGKRLIILDDICDGGGTFVGLANKLLEGGAISVDLYVTHGIFSRGLENLLDNGIYKIYTTDSFESGLTHKRLTIISNSI